MLKTITLELKHPLDRTIDGSELTIDRLVHLSERELFHFELPTMTGSLKLGDLFSIHFSDGSKKDSNGIEQQLIMSGDLRKIVGLSSHTRLGRTVIEGDVGDRFGSSQMGGELLALGSVGHNAFADKRGGMAFVSGNAGDGLGAPSPASTRGIQGGDTIVLGNVGARACERMRRGTVLVNGNTGSYLAHGWIAGTILVIGSLGSHWCSGMKRGSLILTSMPSSPSGATWTQARPTELTFLPILWKHLQKELHLIQGIVESKPQLRPLLSELRHQLPRGRWVDRCRGDLECDGRGELLVTSGDEALEVNP